MCVCGEEIGELGDHCFACRRSNSKILRHTMINECISSSLRSAGVPNKMEPLDVEGKYNLRPDGVSLIPFTYGRSLAWDVSCIHPLAQSHRDNNHEPGQAATSIEKKKRKKYDCLNAEFIFEPIIFDTVGAIGKSSMAVIKGIGSRIKQRTGDSRATSQLRQKLAILIQKGNNLALSFAFKDQSP